MDKVKEIMTQEPGCCTPDTDLPSVAKMMCDYDCGEIPVVDNKESMRPLGVVTDRDITCRLVAEHKNPLELKAKDCMSSPCITVTPETTLDQCCALMEEHQIRRLPVVDASGKCCGIVSQADIALKAPKDKTAEVLQEVSKAA